MKTIFLIIILITFNQIGDCQDLEEVEPAFEMLSKYQKIRDFTMASSSEEAYFTIQSPLEEVCVIAVIKKKNDVWSEPEIAQFSGKYRDLEPFLSPDDLNLYFASNRPLGNLEDQPKDFDIWHVERKNLDAEWGQPINVGPPVNTKHNEFYPAITKMKNLYITSDRPDSKGQNDIFFCEWNNNMYSNPVSISDAINSDSYEFNAYVSPDESFIIFSGYNRADGYGSGDMYISIRDENQNWKSAVNLGTGINSKYMDYCPFVDLNSNTLYLTSRRSSIPEVNNVHSVKDLMKAINTYENGLSRIYKVTIDERLLLMGKK